MTTAPHNHVKCCSLQSPLLKDVVGTFVLWTSQAGAKVWAYTNGQCIIEGDVGVELEPRPPHSYYTKC